MLGYIRQDKDCRMKPQLSMEEIAGVRFWVLHCGAMRSRWQRRRFDRLLRHMSQYGVHQAIVPPHFTENCRVVGIKPISDAPLRQALMEPLLDCFCEMNGMDIHRSTARLYAQGVNETVWRVADLLATKSRYVDLDVGAGQDELSDWLRQEYGLSAGNAQRRVIMQICCDNAKGGETPTLWLGRDCEKHQCVTYQVDEPWRGQMEENPSLLSVLFAEGKLPLESIHIKSVESYA